MSLLLLLLLARPAAADEPAPAPIDAAPLPPMRDAMTMIDEAIDQRRSGDPEGARALLVAIETMVEPQNRSWYLYQRGITEEVAWKPAEARAFYEQVIAIGGKEAIDATFRHALVMEEMGFDEEALDDVLKLAKVRGLDERDETTLALQRGVTEVNTGKVRRGVKRLNEALGQVEGGDTHTWMRAKARYTLAKALLDEADRFDLRGGERRVVRRLKKRAERMKAAEAQIIALTKLQEPEWILASLVALGDSYLHLGDALQEARPPRKLTPEQVEIYRVEVGKKVQNVRTKAYHAYDQGVALATRVAYESPRVQVLKERRAALEAEE